MQKRRLHPVRPVPTWDAASTLLENGRIVVGIDEVGRGAWAGPVVAGAVILPPRLMITGLGDSKIVPPLRRHLLDKVIRRMAIAVGVGWVSAADVDEYGLTWAVRESGLRALGACVQDLEDYYVILDGKHNYLDGIHPSEAIVKADAYVVPVAAASIVAKVARDRYMCTLARQLSGYGFERHKGYGTSDHQAALVRLGASIAHRQSYAPIASLSAELA